MGSHLIRRSRARAHRHEIQRRSASAEALERRVLLSTACIWIGGGVGNLFSSPGNWENGMAPTQPGEIAEFLSGATVSLDVPVQNDATIVTGGTVDFDLNGNPYNSTNYVEVSAPSGADAELDFSDPAAGAGVSTSSFAVDNGEMSFDSGVNASATLMLVAPSNGSVATLNVSSGASVSINGPMTVANQNGSFGTVNVSSEGTLSTNQFSLGAHVAGGTDGVGMLNVSGLAAFRSRGGNIEGYSPYGESTATIDGSGALWDATGGQQFLNIGITSPGEVVVSDDGSLDTYFTQLCTLGGQGSVNIATGGHWTDSSDIIIGDQAGNNPQPSMSYVAVTGWDTNGVASQVNAASIEVGGSVSGQLTVDTGTSVSASGALDLASNIAGRNQMNAELNIMQRALLTCGSAWINGVPAGNSVVYINGGTLQTTNAQQPVNFGPGTAFMIFDPVNGGTVGCAGGFKDNGGGTQIFGPGTFFLAGLPEMDVASGATIEPGSSPSGAPRLATLSVQGDFNAAAGFEYDANLGTAGNSDSISITGNATLAGNFYATSLVGAGTYGGGAFTVVRASSISGQFANLPAGYYKGGSALPQLGSGYTWYVSYNDGQLTLTVAEPPEAVSEQWSPESFVYGGSYGSLSVSGVLDGFDGADQPVTYQIVTEPQLGTVTLDPSTGAFAYTTSTPGVDMFTYTATGETGISSVASVQLNPDQLASFVYLSPWELTVPAGQTVTISPTDDNALLPEGWYPEYFSQIVAGQGPQHASSFTLNPDGSYSYTPGGGFVGFDQFTYQVMNAEGDALPSEYVNVFIDVTSQNDPSALPSNITASPGATYTYDPTTNAMTLNSGTLTFTADTTSGPLPNLTASGPDSNIIFASSQHLAGLTLVGGATATMQSLGAARTASNHNVLVIGSLGASSDPVFTVSASSKLDLEDNDLIVHTGSSDAGGNGEYANVNAMAMLGRNPASGAPGSPDGQWNGNGLASSAANTADTAAGYEKIALAVVLNSTLFIGPYASWQVGSFNETLGSNDIIVKYTYLGDYGLFGKVYDSDAAILQMDFDNGASDTHTWATGSSMDDGLCDDSEAGVFQFQYGLGTGGRFGPQL